jgi:hypothetical protein
LRLLPQKEEGFSGVCYLGSQILTEGNLGKIISKGRVKAPVSAVSEKKKALGMLRPGLGHCLLQEPGKLVAVGDVAQCLQRAATLLLALLPLLLFHEVTRYRDELTEAGDVFLQIQADRVWFSVMNDDNPGGLARPGRLESQSSSGSRVIT